MLRIRRRKSISHPHKEVTIVEAPSFHAIVAVIADSLNVVKRRLEYPLYTAQVDGKRDFLMLDLDNPKDRDMLKESGLTRITYPSYTKGSYHMLLELSRPLKDEEWSAFSKAFGHLYGVKPHKGELFEPSRAPITCYTGKSVQVDEVLAAVLESSHMAS